MKSRVSPRLFCLSLLSRYSENYEEFEQLRRPFTRFEGEPSLDTSWENTFPDNFSDVNSDDMRMPVPEWMNQLEMEEDFQFPIVQKNHHCNLISIALTMMLRLDLRMHPI